MDLIDEVLAWCKERDPNDIEKWEEFAKRYTTQWGWNNKASGDFISWGEYGFNNKKLHESNSLSTFYDELEYCSDRMSLDRLFRCHVLYRNRE